MGRARALEVMLSAGDYNADVAEHYGWINRALPAEELDEFVNRWLVASPAFRLGATSQSKIGSMRLRSRRPRTSAVTPRFLERDCATPRRET